VTIGDLEAPRSLSSKGDAMWRIVLVFVVAAGTLATLAADEPSDGKAIEGTWLPTKAELAGQPWSEAQVKSFFLKLSDGKYEVSVEGQLDRGTYTLDPKSSPKAMTITGTDGPNKGKTFLCIYELRGDTLRVCYDLSGKKTPTAFATAKGTPLYLVSYTRKKDNEKP
jgi:uncharacterized protein (TIGR03067 family)